MSQEGSFSGKQEVTKQLKTLAEKRDETTTATTARKQGVVKRTVAGTAVKVKQEVGRK